MVCSCSSALGFVPSGQAFPAAPCKAGRQPSLADWLSPAWSPQLWPIPSWKQQHLSPLPAAIPCQSFIRFTRFSQLRLSWFVASSATCSWSRLPGFQRTFFPLALQGCFQQLATLPSWCISTSLFLWAPPAVTKDCFLGSSQTSSLWFTPLDNLSFPSVLCHGHPPFACY